MTAYLITTWFTECFKSIIKTFCSEKKKIIPFNIIDYGQCTWLPRALMAVYIKIKVVFIPTDNNHFAVHEIRSNFDFHFLLFKNTFHKAIAAKNSDFSNRSGQNINCKPSGKDSPL